MSINSVQVDNKVSLFNFHTANVRTVQVPDDTNVWFVAKDVTDALGIKDGHKNVQRSVDEEDKQKVTIPDCSKADRTIEDVTANGVRNSQEMTIINESGVYALVFSSCLKKAKEFKRWVTSEVLPTIRKHGMYSQSVASSGLSTKVQALQLAYTEKVSKDGVEILKAVDTVNRYGGLKNIDCKTMCENLGQRFNIAPEIIELINKDGLQALS
ncbi:MAG: BRO-N domain-containing protein [Plesiomonas shigelloides]